MKSHDKYDFKKQAKKEDKVEKPQLDNEKNRYDGDLADKKEYDEDQEKKKSPSDKGLHEQSRQHPMCSDYDSYKRRSDAPEDKKQEE